MSKKKKSKKFTKTYSYDVINKVFETGRSVGQEEAWELAAMIIDWDGDSLERTFGTCNIYDIFKNYTPVQAVEKMFLRRKTHEKEKH